jgi:peptidoglycan/LPS O-acetylase OafA/YrhL
VAIISTSINHLLLELSFLKGFFDSYKFIGVSQGWTLTVEETFYFLFPFIILLSRKRNPLFSFISILTVGLALYFLGHYLQFHNFFYPINFVLLYTFFGRAFEFFIGMQLGKTFVSKAEENINERLIPARTLIGIGGIFLVLYLMSMYQGPKYIYGIFHPTGIILNNLVLPIFIYFLFEGLIFENSLLKDILSTKTFDILGKSSYAFYLIHFTLMRAILKPISLPYLLFFVSIILISIFAYYLIEEPARKIINGVGRK